MNVCFFVYINNKQLVTNPAFLVTITSLQITLFRLAVRPFRTYSPRNIRILPSVRVSVTVPSVHSLERKYRINLNLCSTKVLLFSFINSHLCLSNIYLIFNQLYTLISFSLVFFTISKQESSIYIQVDISIGLSLFIPLYSPSMSVRNNLLTNCYTAGLLSY